MPPPQFGYETAWRRVPDLVQLSNGSCVSFWLVSDVFANTVTCLREPSEVRLPQIDDHCSRIYISVVHWMLTVVSGEYATSVFRVEVTKQEPSSNRRSVATRMHVGLLHLPWRESRHIPPKRSLTRRYVPAVPLFIFWCYCDLFSA
jgi:hypothetical protein